MACVSGSLVVNGAVPAVCADDKRLFAAGLLAVFRKAGHMPMAVVFNCLTNQFCMLDELHEYVVASSWSHV